VRAHEALQDVDKGALMEFSALLGRGEGQEWLQNGFLSVLASVSFFWLLPVVPC
jgi:hypothetical protein